MIGNKSEGKQDEARKKTAEDLLRRFFILDPHNPCLFQIVNANTPIVIRTPALLSRISLQDGSRPRRFIMFPKMAGMFCARTGGKHIQDCASPFL